MTPAAADDSEPDGLAVFGPGVGASASDVPETTGSDPEPAAPALRAFAFLLDGIGTVVVVAVAVAASLGMPVAHAFWAVWVVPAAVAVFDTALTALRGITPGKAVLGLRVVDAGSGAPISIGRAALRGLVIVAPALLGALATLTVARLLPDDPAPLALGVVLPVVGWVALLVLLATRPRHRGLQDLAGRSVVLRVR